MSLCRFALYAIPIFLLSACSPSETASSNDGALKISSKTVDGAASNEHSQSQSASGNATAALNPSKTDQKDALSKPFQAEGFIGDSTCGGSHAMMIKTGSMGETDASCVLECVHAGSRFVFVSKDGTHIYKLRDQDSPRLYAGQKVKISGDICGMGSELDKLNIEQITSFTK